VLTDNGMAFADLPKNRNGPTRRYLGAHIFDRVCDEHGIEHKLTKPYHPWTNGQAERMNRTVKEANIKEFHYPDVESLKTHVLAFVSAYNLAKHLKALRWRTPSKPSAMPGRQRPTSSNLTRVTSSRDQTPNASVPIAPIKRPRRSDAAYLRQSSGSMTKVTVC